jgi:hypothetical protein
MKKYIKIALVFLALLPFISCSPENDIKISSSTNYLVYEEFMTNTTDGQDLNIAGWTNFAQTGTVKWKQGIYSGSKYAEFTSYQSGQATNVAWLVSPAITLSADKNEKLVFDVAQAYVSSAANSIELLISKNYDGTNVLAANWQTVPFTTPPLNYDTNFDFFSSGIIDLATYTNNADGTPYTGNIYLAFKCKGSGTNFSLDGTYELDNIRIFNQK